MTELTQSTKEIWGTTTDVMTKIGFKRTKLGELMREDTTFPKPIRLSRNHLRWNLSEIDAWIAQKESERG